MDKLTKSFIRILKEKGIYNIIPKTHLMSIYIKTININGFIKDLYKRYHIDTKKIFNLCVPKPICENVVVINVNDYNVFGNFLNENGIIWCNHTVFSENDVKRYSTRTNSRTKFYFVININDDCTLSYGEYYNVDNIWNVHERLVLNEYEFYDYYKSIREKMNNNLLFLGDK